MKKRLLVQLPFALAVLTFSCKQTDVFGDIEPNTDRVMAEFTDARTGSAASSDFTTETREIDLTELRLEPRTVTDHSTTVKIIANAVVVSDYNSANGTAYTVPPAGTFVLAKEEYILRPDQRKVMVKGLIKPSALVNGQYAVGLSIAGMSKGDISGTARHVIVFLTVKNSFDGIYSLKGEAVIPGSGFTGPFSVPCSEEAALGTTGTASVSLLPSQPVFSAGSFTYITNLLPEITFDKSSNKVTSVTTRSGGLALIFPFDAGYDSRYDPATKTVYVKYGIAPAGSGRYVIDTLAFCRPR